MIRLQGKYSSYYASDNADATEANYCTHCGEPITFWLDHPRRIQFFRHGKGEAVYPSPFIKRDDSNLVEAIAAFEDWLDHVHRYEAENLRKREAASER